MSESNHNIQYDSPEGETSEEASSAIGAMPNTSSINGPEISTDSLAIGPVMESNDDLDNGRGNYNAGRVQSDSTPRTPVTITKGGTFMRDRAYQTGEEGDDEEEDESEEEIDEGDITDSDEDDEEEEEPVLKYDRIGKKTAEILEKDTASAIAVGQTYFAVGTHNGLVHLFSLSGTLLKTYRPHSASITDIQISAPLPSVAPLHNPALNAATFLPLPTNLTAPSLPTTPPETDSLIISDTIATSSLDGQAILHSLASGTTTGYNFKRPLRSIALEPSYNSSQTKSYVCGGLAGDLVLTYRSSLSLGGLENMFGLTPNLVPNFGLGGGGQSQKIIHSGEGPIWTIRWKGDVIAWANDAGVRLWSVSRGERLAFIEREQDSPRADLFQCTLQWVDEGSLIVGWADLVRLLKVTTRSKVIKEKSLAGNLGVAGGLSLGAGVIGPVAPEVEIVVEVTSVLRLDCMVAGVVPWPFIEEEQEKSDPSVEAAAKVSVPVAVATAPTAVTASIAGKDATVPTRPSTPASTSRSTRPSTPAQLHPSPPQIHAPPSSFLVLSYLPPSTLLNEEATSRADQRRQNSNPPELRIVTSGGEEKSSDVLAMKGYERWGCGDYRIVESFPPPHLSAPQSSSTSGSVRGKGKGRIKGLKERDHGGWLVLSPKGIVHVRKRNRSDRIRWLVNRERYEEALDEIERMEKEGDIAKPGTKGKSDGDLPENEGEEEMMSKEEIGRMYLRHLFKLKEYKKAAKLCPKVLEGNAKAWEDWIFQFAHVEEMSVLVPYVPFKTPRLSKVAYGIILVYYLNHDTPALSHAIKEWPSEIYDIPSLINAIPQPPPTRILMECLADLYIKNRQPGKALPYVLRLRRPNVFQLIRDNNLFTDVQDQALLLVEFDQELLAQREHLVAHRPTTPEFTAPEATTAIGVFRALRTGFAAAVPGVRPKAPLVAKTDPSHTSSALTSGVKSFWTSSTDVDSPEQRRKARGEAIPLLVEHSHSIPIAKVVSQLDGRPYFLYLYLDALFDKDPELGANYVEKQVELYAEFAPGRVIRLMQSAQNLQIPLDFEKIYKICEKEDMVPEMVWVRSRMGDNKGALYLIIDRMGDVDRAIDFAKERKDDDLWEDLLRYSETRPPFIKGLLENVGPEIDPIRIVRRIRNGLEIPGLKEALIKILHDFNLQTSLMEGCGSILESDCAELAHKLQRAQLGGIPSIGAAHCLICDRPLHQPDQDLVLVFLCGHLVHSRCTSGGAGLPKQADSSLVGIGLGMGRDLGAKIAYAEMVRRRLDHGCPVHQKLEQGESNETSFPHLHSHHSHSRHRA